MSIKPILGSIYEQAVPEQPEHVISGDSDAFVWEAELLEGDKDKLRAVVFLEDTVVWEHDQLEGDLMRRERNVFSHPWPGARKQYSRNGEFPGFIVRCRWLAQH